MDGERRPDGRSCRMDGCPRGIQISQGPGQVNGRVWNWQLTDDRKQTALASTALMIFMQKWCWFHFPKYYSFIFALFFKIYWTQSQHLLPARLPLGLCVWSGAAMQRGGARRDEDAGASRAREESQHFGRGTRTASATAAPGDAGRRGQRCWFGGTRALALDGKEKGGSWPALTSACWPQGGGGVRLPPSWSAG